MRNWNIVRALERLAGWIYGKTVAKVEGGWKLLVGVLALVIWIPCASFVIFYFILKFMFSSMLESRKTFVASICASVLTLLIVQIVGWKFTYDVSTNFPLFQDPNPTACLKVWDITRYAEASEHERMIKQHLSGMGMIGTPDDADKYIRKFTPKGKVSPVTGEMVFRSAYLCEMDVRLLLAIMHQDSHFGTEGLAVASRNPGNVGTYSGKIGRFSTWQEGVDAIAIWLDKHRFDGKPRLKEG